jgi:nucleoside-diphosphate-sugar epimerase
MSRILITGAGMVGCHTARALRDAGHEPVFFDAAPRPAYIRRITGADLPVLPGDLRDLTTVLEAVQDVSPDVIVHTAALIGDAAQAVPHRGFEVNVVGSVNVAEAVRLGGVRRLVHASTIGVNDLSQPQPGPLGEDFPVGSGGRIYGASKVACEQLLWAYAREYRFELAILRFAGIYGLGHFAGGSGIGPEILGLVRAALAGEPARLGPGMPASYEIVYVKDVAQGVARAATVPALAHHIYNIGSGVLVQPADVLDTMIRAFPGSTGTAAEPRPDLFPRRHPLDLTRSRAELGYEPAYGLEAGLLDLAGEVEAGLP